LLRFGRRKGDVCARRHGAGLNALETCTVLQTWLEARE
jgi:hypothetical protein